MAPKADSKSMHIARREAFSPLGIVAPPPIHVDSPVFTGSLATLFVCVRDRKLNLQDIPLRPICEAYFGYLIEAAETNLDEAAAALVALAYLLERKAWLLLPSSEPEPEEAEALEGIPATAHEFSSAIEALRLWHEERGRLFFRSPEMGPEPYELPYTLLNAKPSDLARALERMLNRATPEPVAPKVRTRQSLAHVMGAVLLRISDTWRDLDNILPASYTRTDAVYWFLAILELIRVGQVAVRFDSEVAEFAHPRAKDAAASTEEATSR